MLHTKGALLGELMWNNLSLIYYHYETRTHSIQTDRRTDKQTDRE